MKEFFRQNTIKLALGTVFILILLGAALSYYNRYVMNNSLLVKSQTEMVLEQFDRLQDNIRFMDISGRGYALIHNPQFLFWSYETAQQMNRQVFGRLDSLFNLQGLDDPNYPKIKQAMTQYTNMYGQMVQHLENNDQQAYLDMLAFDHGKIFYQTFQPFFDSVNEFETTLALNAQHEYEDAVVQNTVVQFLLFIIGLPTVFFVIRKIIQEEKSRTALLMELDANNRKYLFNDGNEHEQEHQSILGNSISNLQKASVFVNAISAGNYDVNWPELNEGNAELNKENLVGRLVFMRDEMKRVKEEDAKRMWATQGLSEFAEIIRKDQNHLDDLTIHSLTYLVRYTSSQQGCYFLLEEEPDQEPYLKLTACYAFDRRKHVDRRVELGEGLLGQTFLEGQTLVLKTIPAGYTRITSGLGDSTPTSLVIVPLIYNERVYGLLELASFHEYPAHQVSFLEKAGEYVASAVFSAKQNERTKTMLDQMRTQTEQLRSQEEELRQNLEELEATQEAMRRKSVEDEKQLRASGWS